MCPARFRSAKLKLKAANRWPFFVVCNFGIFKDGYGFKQNWNTCTISECRPVIVAGPNQNSVFGCCNPMPHHPDIANTILATATQRGVEKSTCPSEIARILFPGDWRKHMKEIVEVAIDLHHQGRVSITQRGLPVEIGKVKGPIRIKIR